jgi:DNA mismatch repair protein MutL
VATQKVIPEPSRRIAILREDVSRKIAAGEVIDRPLSVVRELLDNALDADAGSVEVHIEGGGVAAVRVVDDGSGMSREDLELCWQRHATSKIREEADLYRVRSLGFRGEALASVGACARLEIVSRLRDSAASLGDTRAETPAHRLRVSGGELLGLEPYQGVPGTVVSVADLFFNMPVRRRFLKNTGSETAACRQAFAEKALAHSGVAFRLFVDGGLRSFFPLADLRARAAAVLALDPGHLYGLEGRGEGFRLAVVAGRPELRRRDRKLIQIYVNRRRIGEYGLVQGAEYAYTQYLPGGHFPVVLVFAEMDPGQVDFNVHPAKREARFRDLPALRHGLVELLRQFLRDFDLRVPGSGKESAAAPVAAAAPLVRPAAHPAALHGVQPTFWAQATSGEQPASEAEQTQAVEEPPLTDALQPHYRGQLFRLFLLVEYGNSLYVVDQHAAHERLLYEQLKMRRPVAQELLMPIRLDLTEAGAAALRARLPLLEGLGIRVESSGTEDRDLEITALPEDLLAVEEDELVEALVEQPGSAGAAGSAAQLQERLLSLAACHLAVKDGEILDPRDAEDLASRALRLDNARCPHGRPLWFRLTEEQLLKAVGRI